MAENSKIEWTDHTINFWWGCEKVHEGCAHCYAETLAKRVGDDIWGKGKPRRWIKSAYAAALKLNERAKKEGVRQRVFCQSMSDIFEEDQGQGIVDDQGRKLFTINGNGFFTEAEYPECRVATLTDLRRQAFALIDATPQLDWLLLTKRTENIRRMWVGVCGDKDMGGDGVTLTSYRPNVYLGTSVSLQEHVHQVERLRECGDLVPIQFLSIEPMLGPIRIPDTWLMDRRFKQWVIVGGESGHGARPMHPDWVRSIRNQCHEAGVPFLFKQWGEWVPSGDVLPIYLPDCDDDPRYRLMSDRVRMLRVGKKAAGRLLDGQEWNEFPQVNQSPENLTSGSAE